MTSPRLTKAGRAVWFIRPPQSDGTIRPVTAQGWTTMGLALALVLLCGLGAMVGIALTQAAWPLITAFIIAAAGLGAFGVLAYRHTE
ncbi:hypothetical protein [Brevundimonas sp.]|uniref:hypothetical protein n=1 Tax=Brevundimonas sp. TaxID=1871086 RepID=UPI003D0EC2B3